MTRAINETLLDYERGLLATMMLRPADCWRVDVQPTHLLSEQHGEILFAIRSLSADSQPVDPVTVADHFEQAGKRDLSNLALKVSGALTTAMPEAYSHRIVTAWRERMASDIGAALQSASITTDDAIAKLMALHASEQKHEFTAKEAAREALTELSKIHEAGGKLVGVPTGLNDIDDLLGGLHAGDLIVVGARAAMGKTSLLINMAQHAASRDFPVGVISGEQPAGQIITRMVSAAAHLPAKTFRTAKFEEHQWTGVYDGFRKVATLPMWILDRSGPSLAEVVRVTRRWVHQHGIKALFVDYAQRIVGEGQRRHEQVGNVVRGLKNLARDLNIPVILLSQVSREAEKGSGGIPGLADLSDTSELEKEADQVLIIYREGYYDENADQGTAIIFVAKNRHGATGKKTVQWSPETMQFHDLYRDEYAA